MHEKNFYNNFCENEKVSVVVQSFKNKNKIEYNCRQLGRPSIDFSKFWEYFDKAATQTALGWKCSMHVWKNCLLPLLDIFMIICQREYSTFLKSFTENIIEWFSLFPSSVYLKLPTRKYLRNIYFDCREWTACTEELCSNICEVYRRNKSKHKPFIVWRI